MRLFSAGVSIDGTSTGALVTVTSNLFMKLAFDTVSVFSPLAVGIDAHWTGRPRSMGIFFVHIPRSDAVYTDI